MRSKEVEKAIEDIKEFKRWSRTLNSEELSYACRRGFLNLDVDKMIQNDIDTVLAYIEELEKENKYLRDENNIYKNETVGKKRIRDKIKELEDRKQKIRFETESEIKRYVEEDLEQDLIFKHRCLEAGYEINKIERDIEVLKSIIGE